jgi:hypothetical protein
MIYYDDNRVQVTCSNLVEIRFDQCSIDMLDEYFMSLIRVRRIQHELELLSSIELPENIDET